MRKKAISKKAMSTEMLITIIITVLTVIIILMITGKLPFSDALSKIFSGG